MLLFAPTHSAELGRRIAAELGVSLSASQEREFDGGEHKMRSLVDVCNEDVFVVQSSCGDAHASANDKLCRLLFFLGALKDAGARRVTAIVPYLAYARKDRRTQPHDPVTTRYVAALFEAVGTDCLVTLEAHNEAAFDNAFRRHAVRLEAAELFAASLRSELGNQPVAVASPDIGGIKRAQRFRETLSGTLGRVVELAFVEKRRAGGVVSGDALVGDVSNRVVCIYDDLIASGGTILRAAAAARRGGATRVYVAASHAALLPAATQLFESDEIDTILTTDSIALAPPFAVHEGKRLRICSVAPLLARTIRHLTASDRAGKGHPFS